MFRRYRTSLNRLACVLASATAAMGLLACGSDDGDESAGGGARAEVAEKAFLTAMVSHHKSAIEMAEIAEQRGQDDFIKKLAGDITSTQRREIVRMEEIYERLFDSTLEPDPAAHDGLGLTAEEAGMTHSSETSSMLRSADPFDRAFVDEMVPHHEGAVRMSKVVLKQTRDAPLRSLAEGIASAQEREIAEMNEFRTKEFGGPVPAGAGHGKKPAHEQPDGEMKHGGGHSG